MADLPLGQQGHGLDIQRDGEIGKQYFKIVTLDISKVSDISLQQRSWRRNTEIISNTALSNVDFS